MHTEKQRIVEVYGGRESKRKDLLYHWSRDAVMLEDFRRKQVTAKLLARRGWTDLSQLEVLDFGCGTGAWLRSFLEWGARPERLHGIDLLGARVARARALAPQLDVRESDGSVPFADERFDLVTANTVLSSIVDAAMRERAAQEMRRVTRRGGLILLYDFRWSDPRNRQTIGISRREVERLFPGLPIEVHSLTLAPPIARRLAPISWLAALTLESLVPLLRTHRLFCIPNDSP